jgi:hypothetical protein
MHVLCTYVDQDAGVILPKFQPSLSELARGTGRDRRTIMRYLNGLETWEWVTRARPAPADARKLHARTNYAIHIGRNPPQASDTKPPDLGAQASIARDTRPPELGAVSREARDTAPHRSSMSSRSTEDEIDAIIRAIKDRSGTTVTPEWGRRVRDQVLGARDNIRDPAAYARRVIMAAPPDTYRPTPTPPRYTKSKGFES